MNKLLILVITSILILGTFGMAFDIFADSIFGVIYVGNAPEGMDVYPTRDTVYTTNRGSPGTVSVIDTVTNTEITQIPVGSNLIDVAVFAARDSVYVANRNSNTVSVINAATNSVVSTIPVGSNPIGLVVDPERDVVYVTLRNVGDVSVIDASTNTVIGTIDLGGSAIRPVSAAINLDTDRLYVAKRGTIVQSVDVIDVTTNTVITTITLGNNQFIRDIVVVESINTIYVSNDSSASGFPKNQVFVIDGNTHTVEQIISMGSAPSEMFFDVLTQFLFVSENGDGIVSVIDTTTNTKLLFCTSGSSPRGLALDTNTGLLYVNNRGTDEVIVIDQCPAIIADIDGDSVPDDVDNCPTVPNPGQEGDNNGHGDACTADLRIEKTGPLTVLAGVPAVFTITVTNNGPATIPGFTLVDDLPLGFSHNENETLLLNPELGQNNIVVSGEFNETIQLHIVSGTEEDVYAAGLSTTSLSSYYSNVDDNDGNDDGLVNVFNTASLLLSPDYLDPDLSNNQVNFNFQVQLPSDTTVIDSDTTGKQKVGPGETLIITNGATITGNIRVDGGTLIIEDGVTVNGNIITKNGGTLSISGDSTVTGNVNSKNADSVLIQNNPNSFGGHVRVDGAATVNISNNHIAENLRVKNSGDVDLIENIIGGHLRSFDNQDTEISDNTVTGNLNTRGTSHVIVTDNTVGGNIRAANSDSVTIEGNSSGQNLRVKNSSDVNVDVNQVGKNLNLQKNTSISITHNHADKNIIIKNNTECSEMDNTADGKIRIKDCISATQNNPPTMGSITITPSTPGTPFGLFGFFDEDHSCLADDVSDTDGDNVTLTYKWFTEDDVLITTGNLLPASSNEGPTICEVTPFDGTDFGTPVRLSIFLGPSGAGTPF